MPSTQHPLDAVSTCRGVVLRVVFHPHQLQVLTAGDDSDVRVWDLVTKSCVAVLKGHFSAVTALSISHDGWTLLSGGRDKVVIAWDLRRHKKLATVPVYEALEGVVVLPPGAGYPGVPAGSTGASAPIFFATGGEKGVVKLWRSDTGACVYEEAAQQGGIEGGNIVEMAMLPGAAGLVSCTQDCRIVIQRPQVTDSLGGFSVPYQT